MEIRGEYWVQDGYVQFADGDIGDYNHERYAIESIFGEFREKIAEFAEKLDIETEFSKWGDEPDTEAISDALTLIYEKLTERKKRPMSGEQASAYIMRSIGCNDDAYRILCGGSGGREYAMEHYGWMAIRGHNVEFYGWSRQRQKEVADAIREILDQEDYSAAEEVDPNDMDIWLEDHATGKTWSMTLAELEAEPPLDFKTDYPEFGAEIDSSPFNKKFTYAPTSQVGVLMRGPNAASDENKDSAPQKGKEKPWNTAAKKAGIGTELWRGTSEGQKWPGFKQWLEFREPSGQ